MNTYRLILLSTAIALLAPLIFHRPGLAQDATAAYRNPRLPVDRRVEDLLSRMTLEEKARQTWEQHTRELKIIDGHLDPDSMAKRFEAYSYGTLRARFGDPIRQQAIVNHDVQQRAIEKTRLGIPLLPMHETLHGLLATGATIYPQTIAQGATWNPELIGAMASAIAVEASAAGIVQSLVRLPGGRGLYHQPGTLDQPGRDYVCSSATPLWPFGFGMSCTTFEYSDLAIDRPEAPLSGKIRFHFTVTNAGRREGKEVAHFYYNDVVSSTVTPTKRLIRFKKVRLSPGESRTPCMEIDASELSLWNREMERVVEPGVFHLMNGPSSADISLDGDFTLVAGPSAPEAQPTTRGPARWVTVDGAKIGNTTNPFWIEGRVAVERSRHAT